MLFDLRNVMLGRMDEVLFGWYVKKCIFILWDK